MPVADVSHVTNVRGNVPVTTQHASNDRNDLHALNDNGKRERVPEFEDEEEQPPRNVRAVESFPVEARAAAPTSM
jgi:hypothetical protein